jgi:hypothetical protein
MITNSLILEDSHNDTVNSPKKKNNTWNDKLEDTAKYIGDMSRIYKQMHIKSAQQSSYIYNIYMYSSIVIGPLAGILTGISSVYENDQKSKHILTILITFMSFFSGIIAAIIKFGKFDEESSSNKLAASRYTSLESNVRRQLALYRKDRINSKDYIEWLNKSFDELFLSSPLLPEYIYEKYSDEAEVQGFHISKYEKIININKDYEDEKIKDFSNKNEIIVNNEDIKDNKDNEDIKDNKDNKDIKNNKNIEDIKDNKNIKNIKDIKDIEDNIIRHRTKSFSAFADLNKYDDSLMQYEIKRFLGFDDE